MTKPWFRLNSRDFSEATLTLHHVEAETSPESPISPKPEVACPSCGMRDRTDLNQLICSQKIQRNGQRVLGWRQAGGIVALKMVLYCMCSLDVWGRVKFHP